MDREVRKGLEFILFITRIIGLCLIEGIRASLGGITSCHGVHDIVNTSDY